ncbi:MAG TPA: hypothetical protein VIY68_17050 [Steroidobacteraceae bacterium]
MDKLIALMIVFVSMVGLVGAAILAIRWKRKSSRRAALLGLGLEFLAAGINPLPPAHVQLEEITRRTKLKKDSASGEPE